MKTGFILDEQRVCCPIGIVLIILPMKHSKSVKTFNLATNLNDYSQEASIGIQQQIRVNANLFDQ